MGRRASPTLFDGVVAALRPRLRRGEFHRILQATIFVVIRVGPRPIQETALHNKPREAILRLLLRQYRGEWPRLSLAQEGGDVQVVLVEGTHREFDGTLPFEGGDGEPPLRHQTA